MQKRLIGTFIILGFLTLIGIISTYFFQNKWIGIVPFSIFSIFLFCSLLFISIKFLLKNKNFKENLFFGGFAIGTLVVLASPFFKNFEVFFIGLGFILFILILLLIYTLFTYKGFSAMSNFYKIILVVFSVAIITMITGFSIMNAAIVYGGLAILVALMVGIFFKILLSPEK